jgi:hypothetical protein
MKKLIGKWTPSIKDDLHAWVVCGVLTQKQADELLKEFKNEKL